MTFSGRTWASLGCLAAAIATPGCANDSVDGTWQSERTQLGDTVSVRTIAGQVWPDDAHPEIDLSIGVLEGDENYMFGSVIRMAEDGRGGVYVMDELGPVIRHFDEFGNSLGTVGRGGEGPGEYGSLSLGLVVDPTGTLFVSDWGNGRLVRFSVDGAAMDPWPIDAPFLTTTPGTWIFSDAPDRVLLRARVGDQQALLVVEEGVIVDTFLVPRLSGLPAERGGPYRVDQYWGWHPEGYFVVGVSNEYRFDIRAPGEVVRISRETELIPVHAEEAAEWRRHFEWMEREPRYNPPAGEWLPSTMPPYRGITVAGDGRIWVRRNTTPRPIEVRPVPNAPPPVAWSQPYWFDVFESDGRFLGGIRFPDSIEPMLFGVNHVWGLRRGDFDEQYVVRMTLNEGTTEVTR